ncbi:MAG TPA: hypothetical protein VEC99_07110 [Clostridia bacterium]|nr:hypothetical protein [Clostridia bacterium]
MRTLFSALALTLVISTGCSEKSDKAAGASTNTTATSSGSSPLNAPADYLGAMVKGKQSAVKTVDTASLDQAIQMFSVDNGRNPKDLDELVKEKYIPKIPEAPFGMKIVYDASSGTVKVVKQ